MATFRNRKNKWQARVQRKGQSCLSKSFLTLDDAKRWARSIESSIDKGSFTNQSLAERTTFKELIERYMAEVTPTMRGAKPDLIWILSKFKPPPKQPKIPCNYQIVSTPRHTIFCDS